MTPDRTMQIARWSLMALCGAAWLLISVFLWTPVISMPNLEDAAPGSYGSIVFTWTIAGTALAASSLIIGRLWRVKIAAPINAAVLVAAIGFILWETMGDNRGLHTSFLALGVAASLLPQLVFGWLLGSTVRVGRAAHVLQH